MVMRQQQGAPRTARIAVAIFFFLSGTIFATWTTRIPAIQARLSLSPGSLGLALLGMAAGALVAMNLSGYLSARFGSHFTTIIGSLCFCIALPLLALAPDYPLLIVALVFFGASNGSMDVAMNTQGVAVEQRYKKPILNSFHACWSFGGLIGSLVGGLVAARDVAPWLHFLVIAILCVIGTLLAARFLLPTQANTRGSGVVFVRPTRSLLILGLVALCSVVAEGAIGDWSALYLSGTVHTGAGLAASGFAALSIMMAAGRGVGDQLTARFGPAMMVRLGGLVAAVGLTLTLVFPWLPVAIIGFGLVGLGLSTMFPLVLSAAGRTSPQAIAAVATCGYTGFLIGPPVIGFAADILSLRIALGFVVVLSLCAALCARAVDPHRSAEKALYLEDGERSEPLVR